MDAAASEGVANVVFLAPKKDTAQDGAPKIAKLPYKWLNYGLW